jgi:1-pyrroline-5-carboxylate dehydrogenase
VKLRKVISIIAHPSSNPKQVATGIVRGAFEFQGQKISSFKIHVPKKFVL